LAVNTNSTDQQLAGGSSTLATGNTKGKMDMNLKRISIMWLAVAFVITTMSAPVLPQSKKNSADDVSMELIGQVINPTPSSSVQYGYLSYVNGIDTVFSGDPHDETTALFSFYNDTTNTQVINHGPFRVINRVGTSTIYLNNTPNRNFANPSSFSTGTPLMTAAIRMQVIVDNVAGTFTATFVLTITSSESFRLGIENLHLGRIGQRLRLTFIGHLNTPAPPVAHIAGFVVGGDLTR
jgi:hypothetical protein